MFKRNRIGWKERENGHYQFPHCNIQSIKRNNINACSCNAEQVECLSAYNQGSVETLKFLFIVFCMYWIKRCQDGLKNRYGRTMRDVRINNWSTIQTCILVLYFKKHFYAFSLLSPSYLSTPFHPHLPSPSSIIIKQKTKGPFDEHFLFILCLRQRGNTC